LKLIGTRPDREVARLLNRNVLAVKAKKFQLQKENPKDEVNLQHQKAIDEAPDVQATPGQS
jgi:hypothetical protein